MNAIGVIGGGIVGIAVARALAMRGDTVTVLEKEARLARHQTGHNSGVVHAGIYYAPGSLKATLCALGRQATRDYCQEKSLPYLEVGKLVVAVDTAEVGALDELERRSRISGVPGLRRLSAAEISEIEPACAGVAALHSPHTAVVDYARITDAMAMDVEQNGGTVLLSHEVTGIRRVSGEVIVTAGGTEHRFARLIVCAGLQSDLLAKLAGSDSSPKVLPFRGEYWAMRPERADMVRGMIYPVPDPRFPFLGVHFTRGVYGNVHIGPSAVPALAREGYRWRDVSVRDTWDSLRWPGATKLFRDHWRMGAKEITGSLVKRAYYREARRFLPELLLTDLDHKTDAGVRAQAWSSDGSLLDDFAIDQLGPITILRNAPSPAATSAMAIANHLLTELLPQR